MPEDAVGRGQRLISLKHAVFHGIVDGIRPHELREQVRELNHRKVRGELNDDVLGRAAQHALGKGDRGLVGKRAALEVRVNRRRLEGGPPV